MNYWSIELTLSEILYLFNFVLQVLVIIDKNESFKNLVTYIQDNQVKKGRFSARVGRTFNVSMLINSSLNHHDLYLYLN